MRPSRLHDAYLLAVSIAAVAGPLVSCGGSVESTSLHGGASGGTGGSTAGPAGGVASSAGGATASAGGASGAGSGTGGAGGAATSPVAELDQTCGTFLPQVNGAPQIDGCISCIDGATKGACAAEMSAAQATTGACATVNDCVSNTCKCEGNRCPPTFCECLHGCVAGTPDCAGAWAKGLGCLSSVCSKACS